jgi:hypothetical protein
VKRDKHQIIDDKKFYDNCYPSKMHKLERDYNSRVNFYDEKGIYNIPPAKPGKKLFKNDLHSSFVPNTSAAERSFGFIKKEKPVFVKLHIEGPNVFKSQIGTIINNSNLIEVPKEYGKKRPDGVRDVFQSQIKNLISMT